MLNFFFFFASLSSSSSSSSSAFFTKFSTLVCDCFPRLLCVVEKQERALSDEKKKKRAPQKPHRHLIRTLEYSL